MELIDQRTKKIMEGCKERALDAGLRFDKDSLEYIVSNRDLIELSPKYMIPTLYDYWVHDVEVLKEKSKYELYPSNPYETVINTRPAISFYNDNNPDWLNVMIFYHVLGHIDFFQNNIFFQNTWDYDFNGQALSDKRLIAKLRSEKGRWVDYVIEFARGIDNLVAYHSELEKLSKSNAASPIDFYFDVFLQKVKKVPITSYMKEIDRYNEFVKNYGDSSMQLFFSEVRLKNPEFDSLLEKFSKNNIPENQDILQFILNRSPFLNKDENSWMKSVIEIVRKTSLFFQPQIRTKIMNEGWASYWHEKLFLTDDRICGHEIDFARIHSGVVSLPRVGLNPYALGMRLFEYIEDCGNKGKFSFDFDRTTDAKTRSQYDTKAMKGRDLIFELRKNLSDQLFIDTYLDQDFVDINELFVTGRRLNKEKMVWEYYVKSRDAKQYREMMHDHLYHPPYISVNEDKCADGTLYVVHRFEGKPLVQDFIANTMLGIEFLWGKTVNLETSVAHLENHYSYMNENDTPESSISWKRMLYTMNNRHLTGQELKDRS
jgi:stage V sporulation protein R